MAVADMTGATNPEEAAYCWSRFIIEDLMEKRIQGVGIQSSVYPFNLGDDGKIIMPTQGLPLGHPPTAQNLFTQLEKFSEGLYAYLIVMIGLPQPPGVWDGPSVSEKEKSAIPIGVPMSLCEEGDHQFYLFASLTSSTMPVTWAVRFDGAAFGEIRRAGGSFGGSLVGRLGFGDN